MAGSNNQITSGFVDSDGSDVGLKYVNKGYLIDVYPYLNLSNNSFSMPGLCLWGDNSTGQLTTSPTTETWRSSPTQTFNYGNNWKQVACSYRTVHGIKSDGTLWNWGDNYFGQLGDNTVGLKSSPVQTVSRGTNWVSVTCTGLSTHAIKSDGTLWNWGDNYFGQLGDNTKTNRSSPVQTVALGTNWKQVSSAYSHTLAIKTDGTLWAWGADQYGQLGDNTTTTRRSPVQTAIRGTNWKTAYAAPYSSSAIKTDGTLWAWGGNYIDPTSSTSVSSPIQTGAATNWKKSAGYLAGGGFFALKTDGTLWYSQGADSYGNFTWVQESTLSNNWKDLEASGSLGLKSDGTLWYIEDSFHTVPTVQVDDSTNWKVIATSENQLGGTFAAIKEVGDDF